MKTFLLCFALLVIANIAIAETITVKVPIPEGAKTLDLNFTVSPPPEPPVVVVPPLEPPTPVPPVEPPIATGDLVYPDERPAWCGLVANFCMSVEDSRIHRTPYIMTQRFPNLARYHFSFQPGTHVARLSVKKLNVQTPVIMDGNGATLDCLNSIVRGADRVKANQDEGKGCVVHNTPLIFKNFHIVAGEGLGPIGLSKTPKGSGGSFRCIRPESGNLIVEDVTFDGCKNGVQGDGNFDWTFRRVVMNNCSIKGTGQQHCIYSSSGTGTIIVEDSFLSSHAGHVVKSGAKETIIQRTALTEGSGDTGAAIHSTSNGDVTLEDVTIRQLRPHTGNVVMLLVGDGKLSRCKYDGTWKLKNVTMVDDVRTKFTKAPRIRAECTTPTVFEDLGGNTFDGRPLFVEGALAKTP